MKNPTKRIVAIAVAGLPAAALAHPGHATLAGGPAHVLASPDHLAAAALFIAALAVAAVMFRRARKRKNPAMRTPDRP